MLTTILSQVGLWTAILMGYFLVGSFVVVLTASVLRLFGSDWFSGSYRWQDTPIPPWIVMVAWPIALVGGILFVFVYGCATGMGKLAAETTDKLTEKIHAYQKKLRGA